MRGEILELLTPQERLARKLLSNMPGVINVGIFGDRVHVVVQDARAMTAPILARLAPEGVTVENIRQIPPGLEDVFISLIR
jgi:ABC-2 type transport system ATP-binding protein